MKYRNPKTLYLLSYCLIVLLLSGCSVHHYWTDEQRDNFEKECAQSDSLYNYGVSFIGFEDKEFDSVVVMEFKDTGLVDSFKLFVFPSQNPYEREKKERSSHAIEAMNINNKYHFMVPAQTFELTNMKKIMHPQYSETSEGWGCVLGSYTVDGIKIEGNRSIEFIKREQSH